MIVDVKLIFTRNTIDISIMSARKIFIYMVLHGRYRVPHQNLQRYLWRDIESLRPLNNSLGRYWGSMNYPVQYKKVDAS